MDFGTHVFISYAHADNLEAGGPGWVTRFHELLEPFLTSRLRKTKAVIWRDKRLSDNDVFDPVIMQRLPDSAVMVAVLTDNYVDSRWCQREAEAFCEAAMKNVGLAPGDKSRLFKVIKLPPEQQNTLPPPMRQILGTPFFTRVDKDKRESEDENDPPLELDPNYGPAYAEQLKVRVALLAQDIATTLKMINAAAGAMPVATVESKKPAVYLAQCGEDRRNDREALRSELVQRGYPVLPDRELPMAEAAYRAEVARLLERSALSIHLLGTSPGPVPDGEGEDIDSVLVIQNALSVERAKGGKLQRVVSLSEETVAKRPRHQQFLDAMRREAAVQGGAEVIAGDLEAVKAAMHVALKNLEKPQVAQVAAPAAATKERPSLYVIFDKRDYQATGDLRDTLEQYFEVYKPVFEGTAEEVRQANLDRLSQCDAVLIYYGSGTDLWMASVLSEVERAVVLRPGRPFRAVLKWIAGPPTDDKNDRIRRPKPDVVNALSGFSESLVEPIRKMLLGPGHG